jgi:hypothetical protein
MLLINYERETEALRAVLTWNIPKPDIYRGIILASWLSASNNRVQGVISSNWESHPAPGSSWLRADLRFPTSQELVHAA